MYPPAWTLARTATTDTYLGEHPIPAGTILIYSPYLLHHLPDFYPDPDRSDPDRWIDGLHTAPPREAFIPFAAGARKCIGDTFAVTEATLVLATLAARWRLQLLPSQHVRPSRSVVLHPRGLRMRATQRGEWRRRRCPTGARAGHQYLQPTPPLSRRTSTAVAASLAHGNGSRRCASGPPPLRRRHGDLGACVNNKSGGGADRPLDRLGPLSGSRRVRRTQFRGSAARLCLRTRTARFGRR